MAPLWWVTLYGLTLAMFLGVNWLNFYGGREELPMSDKKLPIWGSHGGTRRINWKW